MAKLSTPFHACDTVFQLRTANGLIPTNCRFAAYRRLDGKWACKGCLRKARAAKKAVA